MGDETGIEWTQSTFNPWMGCTKVSPACTHCYAERDTKRYGIVEWGPDAERKRTSDENWKKPRRWNREAEAAGVRRRVFCASLADVFEDRPELARWREDLLRRLILETPWLDWQLLTKRPENMVRMTRELWPTGWPDNVWAGTTVENQEWADKRLPHLLSVPARVRFVSCEPLLGPLDLRRWLMPFKDLDPSLRPTPRLSWVIVGGESGGGFRVTEDAWVRSLWSQTREAGVAFFHKQGYGVRPDKAPTIDGVRYAEFPVSGG